MDHAGLSTEERDKLDEILSKWDNYNPAVYLTGQETVHIHKMTTTSAIVNFTQAFNEPPTVTAVVVPADYSPNMRIEGITEITQTGFIISIYNTSVAANCIFKWTAQASGFTEDPVI